MLFILFMVLFLLPFSRWWFRCCFVVFALFVVVFFCCFVVCCCWLLLVVLLLFSTHINGVKRLCQRNTTATNWRVLMA